MRGYASRRSSSDASGCSIAVASGWEAAAAEPAPRRATRTQQATTAIRACLQIVNVSSGEKARGNPGRPASLEDSVRPLPRFRRNQTRPLHALRTTIRQVPLGPGRCSRRLLARVRPGQLHTDEPKLDRGGRALEPRARVRRGLLAGRTDPRPCARLRLAARAPLPSGPASQRSGRQAPRRPSTSSTGSSSFSPSSRSRSSPRREEARAAGSPGSRSGSPRSASSRSSAGSSRTPSSAPAELAQSFPTASKRLSFPVDYWNGLATLVAFAIPCSPVLRGRGARSRARTGRRAAAGSRSRPSTSRRHEAAGSPRGSRSSSSWR